MESYQQLEHDWAKANDLDPRGVVACSSGTAALHLALEALQLPPGSEVIVPDFTMIACARAVSLAGLKPRFVDCDPNTLLIDDDWVKVIDGPTQAIMFVHVYGRRCVFPEKWDEYSPSLRVIEDLAEAHGVKPHEATDAACWSFYKNKIVHGEEGGAVWFKDPGHAILARRLRSLGFTEAHDFFHVPRGHNYRMSNAHARLILPSIDELTSNLEKRRRIEYLYNQECPEEWKQPQRNVVWVYDIRIPGLDTGTQTRIVTALQQRVNIPARHGFRSMSLQEEYRTLSKDKQLVLSDKYESIKASREVIYFPVEPTNAPDHLVRPIIQRGFVVIREVLGGR